MVYVVLIFLHTECKGTVHQVPETVDCCAGCLQQGHDVGWVRRREEQGQQQQGQEYDPGWHRVMVAGGTCNSKWHIWSGQLTEHILEATEWGLCVEPARNIWKVTGTFIRIKSGKIIISVDYLIVLGRLFVLRRWLLVFLPFCPYVPFDRFMTMVNLINDHPV